MVTIRKILCPINLSAESAEALRYGVAIARAYQAKLVLLYCGEAAAATGNMPASVRAEDCVKALFKTTLERYSVFTKLPELDWEGIVIQGGKDAGEEIVREAAEQRVNLIVMRSRRRPFAATLLGSTAERVYRTAPCPVLITHPKEQEWVSTTTGEIDLKRVLVAYDFSIDSELALHYAVSLAQEYQAELHIIHVVRRPERDTPELSWGQPGVENAYHAAARRLQQTVPAEAHLWCRKVTYAVHWGKPYQEVLAYAAEQEIDLICMGSQGRDVSKGALFGSNVDRVLRQAPCPVLVSRILKPAITAPLECAYAIN